MTQIKLQGYNKAREDKLLEKIVWPNDGYRLFEVGTPLWVGVNKIMWLHRMFDSLGGADTNFSFPGGDFLNHDLYKRICDASGVRPVQLIGERSFHQLHGGTTTNVTPQERRSKTEEYRQEYM